MDQINQTNHINHEGNTNRVVNLTNQSTSSWVIFQTFVAFALLAVAAADNVYRPAPAYKPAPPYAPASQPAPATPPWDRAGTRRCVRRRRSWAAIATRGWCSVGWFAWSEDKAAAVEQPETSEREPPAPVMACSPGGLHVGRHDTSE